ncbi:short-chain dehydrogenase, partial [Burkholderia humptydooensis]
MTAPADTCDTSAARSARVVLITGAVQTGAVQAGAAEAARASAQQTPDTAAVGHALAVGFARRGWDVALAAAAGDEARAAAALAVEVEALGRRAAVLVADLSVEADVARLVAACDAALGRPTCVVAQAAGVADNAHDVGYASLAGAMARGVAAPLVLARALADATPDAARDDERERAVVIHLLDETLFHPAPERLSHS